jgi:ABC-type cobalamin/Fe3+-siderophores transport system ATPase subunit
MMQEVDKLRNRIASLRISSRIALIGPVGVGKTTFLNGCGSALAAECRFQGAAGTGARSMTKAPRGDTFQYAVTDSKGNTGFAALNNLLFWDSPGDMFDVRHCEHNDRSVIDTVLHVSTQHIAPADSPVNIMTSQS